MKLLLLAVAIIGIVSSKSLQKTRGLDKDDDWFESLRDLGTEVIVDTFDLGGVKDMVKQSVEECMQEDDTTTCLEGKVDAVSDALGVDVPQADREEAKVKVAALSDFLGAVYGSCRDKSDDELGICAWEEGNRFCEASDFDKKECMGGVFFVLKKAEKMYGDKKAKGGKKEKGDKKVARGLDRDDEWFDDLRDLGSAVIVDIFQLQGAKDLVKQNVEKCMLEDDTTECLEGKVDTITDTLGADVSEADRDHAKAIVAALSDFLGAVHGSCKGLPDEEIGKCAFEEGERFCADSEFDQNECMGGVIYVLKKAEKMHNAKKGKSGKGKGGKGKGDKGQGGMGKGDKTKDDKTEDEKRGLDRDDDWFDELRDLGTKVIVDTFNLGGVKDLVKSSVEDCMQKEDTTGCLEGEVDNIADALGFHVPKSDRDEAKVKVAALSDYLGAVHAGCKGLPDDEIGKCAWEQGENFCDASNFDRQECMGGVYFVLKKAEELFSKK